jgi:superfamily II DNA or RNA helicase
MIIDSVIKLDRDELSRKEWDDLLHKLTYLDNDEIEVQSYDWNATQRQMRLPRGTWDMLPGHVKVRDNRTRPTMPKVAYAKQLDAEGYAGQSAAVRTMAEIEQGQVIAPPGRGKTEMGLAFAASCRTRTLVIVHTQALLRQWVNRAKESTPTMAVGVIQGSTCDVQHLTIAMAQTLKRYVRQHDFWPQFGCVIVDEAHHAAAETWDWILNVCPAYYRFGITASEKRSDGRQPSVRFNIGPVIYKLKFESGVPMKVIPVETRWRTATPPQRWAYMMRELVNDEGRNQIIASAIDKEVREGNYVLVLSRQIKHLENIAQLMSEDTFNKSKLVTGKLSRRLQTRGIKELAGGEIHCILGTQLFEEGVDIPRLNRIVLAFPGTDITVLQKVGRGARSFEGKTECIVLDFVDDFVPVLARQWNDRKAWYKRTGIEIGGVMWHAENRKAAAKGKVKLAGAAFIKSLKVAKAT